jgi:alpha(1,3/1,4) fucosyltransferase
MGHDTIDFIGIVNNNCPTLVVEADYSKLFLLEAALKDDKSLIADISDNRFNLMQAVSSRLYDKEGDIEYIVCALISEEFEENDSSLNWVVNLFNSTEVEVNSSELQNTKPVLKVRLLNQWHGANINHFSIIKDVIEETHIVRITELDDYDLVIDGVFDYESLNNKNSIKISYSGEALSSKIDGYDLSLGFEYLDYKNYIRLPLYYLYFNDLINSNYRHKGECNPDKVYFACFLVSNPGRGDGAIARTHMFNLLSSYKFVASGGRHLNNIGRVIPHEETYQFLSQCKFIIAYENNGTFPGYITEKVFQAYFAGGVPLYYSHFAGQESDLNHEAIISAQHFSSEVEMVKYIIDIDNDHAQYCKLWNSPILKDIALDYEIIKEKIRNKIQSFIGALHG